jgi:hypothetical protein
MRQSGTFWLAPSSNVLEKQKRSRGGIIFNPTQGTKTRQKTKNKNPVETALEVGEGKVVLGLGIGFEKMTRRKEKTKREETRQEKREERRKKREERKKDEMGEKIEEKIERERRDQVQRRKSEIRMK